MVDPLAELHDEITPYNYVLNNPLLYFDEFGLDTTRRNKPLEVTISSKKNNASTIAIPIPRSVPTITPVPPPNPIIVFLAAFLLPANYWEAQKGFRPGEMPPGYNPRILRTEKSVEDLKTGATYRGKTGGKGGEGTDIYDKTGGMGEANKDFNDIVLDGSEKEISSGRVHGRTGKTVDGKTITVRDGNSEDRPTLEIYNPATNIKKLNLDTNEE